MKKAIATLGALAVAASSLVLVATPANAADNGCTKREYRAIKMRDSGAAVKRITGEKPYLYSKPEKIGRRLWIYGMAYGNKGGPACAVVYDSVNKRVNPQRDTVSYKKFYPNG